MGRISLRRSSGDGLPRSSGRRSDHPEDQRQVLPRREGESLGKPSHLKTAPVHIWRRVDGWPLRNHIAGPFLPAIIAPFFTATVIFYLRLCFANSPREVWAAITRTASSPLI